MFCSDLITTTYLLVAVVLLYLVERFMRVFEILLQSIANNEHYSNYTNTA
jgi:hypothetical protein